MTQESKNFSFSELTIEPKPEAEYIKDLCDVADLFTQTGAIFEGIRVSKYAADVTRLTAELISVIALTHPDEVLSKEAIIKISEVQNELQGLYWDFLVGKISVAAIAIQSLPPTYLFESADVMGDDEVGPGGMTSIEGKSRMMVKPCAPLMALIAVGIAASSETEFTRLQMEVISSAPKNVEGDNGALISAQITGALMAALADRSKAQSFASTQILGVIQSVNAAQRCTAIPFIADWRSTGVEIVEKIMGMAITNVENNLIKDESEAAEPKEENFDAMIKKTSTPHAGNKTVN